LTNTGEKSRGQIDERITITNIGRAVDGRWPLTFANAEINRDEDEVVWTECIYDEAAHRTYSVGRFSG